MAVDTGSAVSIVSEVEHNKWFKHLKLQQMQFHLKKRFLVLVSTVSARTPDTMTPHLCIKYDEKPWGVLGKLGGGTTKNWVGVCGTLPETLTLFQKKGCDFPYPISNLKPWSPAHDRSA